VQEDETSSLSVPRLGLPSLDLTQMRNTMGTGYSPTSPAFPRPDRLQTSDRQLSDTEDESTSPVRTWSSIGGPDSQISTSAITSELYIDIQSQSNIRSQPLDEEEANQVVQSLSHSAWGGAIRSPTRSRTGRSENSAGSDNR
jgi:hypothetical protein